jgi:uncharacterized HhH-GPD family protein
VNPDRLHFTPSDEANELIARDPLALLIGFALDQQMPVPTVFQGPLKLQERLGALDAEAIARLDPAALEQAFRQPPAVHRFPGAMAKRVQELCATVVDEYGGRADAVWADARDADDLRARIGALPGFGEMKIKALASVLAKHYGVQAAEPLVPDHPTLGDVVSAQTLEDYQAWKREHKAKQRAKA